jgi:hypothetical protein
MAGFFSDLGIDTNAPELNQAQKVSTGGLLAPGVYEMVIDKVYATKADSGAVRLNAELKYQREDGSEGTFFWNTWVQSGDEKGNKATYTDKNGNQKPLPGVIEMRHFFKSAGVEDPQVKPATIEVFGEPTEVKALPELTGKKVLVGIRHMYDDYKEQDVAFVDTFLSANGKNSDGEDLREKLEEKIKKNPYKKAKGKKEPKKETKAPTENVENPWA